MIIELPSGMVINIDHVQFITPITKGANDAHFFKIHFTGHAVLVETGSLSLEQVQAVRASLVMCCRC